ncbi:xanthine phosphoribosyltransferase Xpt [Thermoclostridium stercorarium subsp. stercorarium DSM 8532]|jgi:xanthine phosphoribosyltransferase|uniref:Xanthine phosphoribosyltransferase n=3 Tax=Thermoclostridium stercorarium TaxID=1510 RepID=L7VPH2_THES1|nr:xanthine phosphoribosyltransferase [Thermoclostridium stercorarium]AGC68574.1 xanthine phosphoribosyltransferase Xpt [Thermoclostridium stercorarium subsp. stercorarium DSM 8532]AGI39590.1 xanthine phosphoribosyltransferase [Thermoclostridium stercorarium subsp. stercorarium DSM 8532]ANW98923.1 xanthine phosphoribosyltransferase [Thermoclostridium stercorarium subsp. thermolacticum DSM 2910]ANX01451.1 xanthine phosphoribosyltransferase [Thermoclostridium stercorarium subsp. leptospartum DSM 
MESLKQRILKDGVIIDGNILKVDSFLNHQIDPRLAFDIGKEFYNRFKNARVDKILTVETSGIAFAVCTGYNFNVPVVFAKKYNGLNMSPEVYRSKIRSYTKQTDYIISVSKEYLSSNENILIIDDFLANGQAVLGLIDIANQAKCNITGVGIVIEKGFQQGGQILRNLGIRLESLAVIESFNNNKIIFRED